MLSFSSWHTSTKVLVHRAIIIFVLYRLFVTQWALFIKRELNEVDRKSLGNAFAQIMWDSSKFLNVSTYVEVVSAVRIVRINESTPL